MTTEKDTFALTIEILKTSWSLIADVYEHVYVHASVYMLAAARASLTCLPLTILRVMLMMNTVLMRWIVSSRINRAIRKPRKGKIAQTYREYLEKLCEKRRNASTKVKKIIFKNFVFVF